MNGEHEQHWTSDAETLEAFIRNRLDERERAPLAAHLESCADCRARVRAERELIAGIRSFGRTDMKRRLNLRLRRDRSRRFEWTQVASIAAAVILMLSAVFVIRWATEQTEMNSGAHAIAFEQKSTKAPAHALWIIGTIVPRTDALRKSVPSAVRRFAEQDRADERFSPAAKSAPAADAVPAEKKREPTPNIVAVRQTPSANALDRRDAETGSIRTLLERTPDGIRLTVFTDAFRDSIATRVEAVTHDSILVTFGNVEIAYRLPEGWAGKL